MTPEEQLLIYSRRPSRKQARALGTAALVLLVATAASLPFRRAQLEHVDAFIPVVDTVLLVGDVLTATLLFAQASVLRSRALMALATGYLFTGLIIIPHALTFPGAFSASGLLGAGVSTTIWLYFFWHGGLPLAVIAYASLKKTDEGRPMAVESVPRTIALCAAGSAVLVVALTLLATVGEPLLPRMMTDATNWLSSKVLYVALSLLALLALAMAAVWRGRRSILDLWLLLALWAWSLELVLVMATSARYSGGWYVGRTAGLFAGVLVLLMLLAETNTLYARLALSVMAERRERETRLISMNAVAASIAHEVKQPLTAIVANAQAGTAFLKRRPADVEELSEILTAIAHDGLDAAHVVDSIRAMFGKRASEKAPLDVNELIRETTSLVAGELSGWRIALQLQLDAGLPRVAADRIQIQHVLLNLFVNAIEAMAVVDEHARVLRVRAEASEPGAVRISVQDSGPGIDPAHADRLFDAFFTTKQQGTGMGLHLCRSIVEAHGGRLWVAAGTPLGATFHVQLPLEARDAGSDR